MNRRCCIVKLCLCFLIIGGFILSGISFAETGIWRPASSLPQKAGVKQVLARVNNWGINNTISVDYQVPSLTLKAREIQRLSDEKEETCILGNAVPIYNEGEPVLPAVFARIILPYGHTVDKISVERGNATPVQGQHFIEYGPAAVVLMPGVKARKAVPKAEIYTSDNPFPAQTHKLVTIQKMRGVTFAYIQVYPVTYYPKSGKLEYYKNISVQVTTKPAKDFANSNIRVRLAGMKSMCREAENIELLTTYQDGAIQGTYQRGICNPREDYKWVFVTSEAIANASTSPSVSDLVQQRQSMGFTAKVMTIEDVKSNYDGVDNAEKLRNFVIDAYNNWSTEFVVLGGDVDVVPLRQLYCYVDSENEDQIDSDIYFQCLDGEYNYNGNTNWGEPDDGFDYEDVDLLAEVFIGRISAENATEMANALYKIIAYENSPADESYLKTVLMLGEHLGWTGDMEYAKPSLLQIVNGVDSLNLKGFVEVPEITVEGLYEADGSYSKTDVLNKINSETYSIIHHFGHSNASYGLKLRNGDESDFTNDKFIFGYSQGCLTGEFSKDCIAERFTTSTRTGFWGTMFNSNLGFGYENNIDGPAQILAREFWDAYFGENMEYVGALSKDAHDDNLSIVGNALIRWSIFETNLLGDPAVKIRGKVIPDFIAVTSPNGGEKWEQGRAFDIAWNDNITENVKIELLKGTAVDRELAASEPSDGSFTWDIASDFPLATDYKIRVTSTTNGSLVDESFEFFAIEAISTLGVTAPNGGETVIKGSDYEIKWSDNLSGNVNIDLYKNGEFCRNVVLNTESDGSYTWTVHKVIAKASDYKIRVTSVDKSWLFDESDADVSFDNPIISTFPYFEDFDEFELGAGALGGYWEQIIGDDDFNWTVQEGPTPSNTTGPDEDHTSGSGMYIFTEASSDGNPNKKFYAVTPVFDFTGLAEPYISFWYHMRSDTNRMGDLYLDIFVDNAWTEGIVHISGHQGTDWLEKILDLNTYIGKQVQFRFRGVTDTSFDSDMAVDDVLIDDKTAISTSIVKVPQQFGMKLYGSRIHYQVRKQQHISIKLYNIQGKLIRTLVNGAVKAGYHSLPVNGSNKGVYELAAGLYLCKMETKGFCKTINVIVKK